MVQTLMDNNYVWGQWGTVLTLPLPLPENLEFMPLQRFSLLLCLCCRCLKEKKVIIVRPSNILNKSNYRYQYILVSQRGRSHNLGGRWERNCCCSVPAALSVVSTKRLFRGSRAAVPAVPGPFIH